MWWWWVGCERTETTDSATTAGVAWSAAFDPAGAGALSGVWGSGPDDVWVVGGTPDRADVFHFDGAGWSPVSAPDTGLLVWVYGFGPDDAIAVGVGGGVARWDGANWEAVDSGTTADLWGVWGRAPDDLWIVGGDPGAGEPTILHGDGTSFTPVALDPAQNDRLAHALFKVFGVGGRTFAVGQAGLIVEWDGGAWVQRPTGAAATDDFVAVWGASDDDLLAVGGRSNAQLARFDGATWTTTSEGSVPGLSAVTAVPDGFVVAGLSGWVGHVGGDGVPVREDGVGPMDLHAAWFDGEERVYVVGGRFYEPYEGTALVREEGK